MILPDSQLDELMRAGYLPEGVHIGPSSVDLRLGEEFRFYPPLGRRTLELDAEPQMLGLVAQELELKPGEFVLATTVETVTVPPDLCAFVQGRSSIGRLGLQVQNAGFVDAGFQGEITLELFNQAPHTIRLRAGIRIAQMIYLQMQSRARHPYSGRYQGQSGPTASRISIDGGF